MYRSLQAAIHTGSFPPSDLSFPSLSPSHRLRPTLNASDLDYRLQTIVPDHLPPTRGDKSVGVGLPILLKR
jgi:hypothetical protein